MSSPNDPPPPPPARDREGRPVTPPDGPYEHRHDEKLDYTSENAARDTVAREEYVDNDDKALPSDRNTSLFVAIGAAVLAVLAIVLAFAMDWDAVGTVVAVIAVIVGGIATLMAVGDARASPVAPAIVTVAAIAVAIIVALDWADAEDVNPAAPGDAIVGDGERSELTDGDADLGDPE